MTGKQIREKITEYYSNPEGLEILDGGAPQNEDNKYYSGVTYQYMHEYLFNKSRDFSS